MSFIVAIDGPAGSGKGTIAKEVAQALGFIHVDTGAMFRCVTLHVIQQGIAIEQQGKIEEMLNKIDIDLKENGEVFLNGEEVSKKIREDDVTRLVSPVSVIPAVRKKLLEKQRQIAQQKNVVMEGRDIGTIVFPHADVKIYLDASPEVRARRRVKQNEEKGMITPYEETLKNIMDRDKRDATRKIAPLKQAEDAIYIDSSNMIVEEVVKKIVNIIEQKKLN